MSNIPRDIRETLLDYALGQLPPDAAGRVEEQLPTHPDWVRFIDRARRMVEPLDRWPAPPVPADLVGRTLRAVREHDRQAGRRHAPARPRRHLTFTLLESVAVAASVALVAFLLLPSLHNAQLLSLEKGCEVNLQKIGQAMAAFAGPQGAGHLPRIGTPAADAHWNHVGADRDLADNQLPADRSNTRALWQLVRAELIAPKYFVCPLSEDRVDATPPTEIPAKYDFADGRSVSYSYQVWLGPNGNPARRSGALLPILADRSPMFDADGTPVSGDSRQNSPNHEGRGQFALLSDLGTVRWLDSPDIQLVGGRMDNLLTPYGQPAGKPLTGQETPASPYDVLLGP